MNAQDFVARIAPSRIEKPAELRNILTRTSTRFYQIIGNLVKNQHSIAKN